MKKLIFLIMIIFSIIILGIIVSYRLLNNDTIIIKDYFGNNITNYETNTNAFIIESKEKVFVNGEEYNKNNGIYKPGTYEIKTNSKTITVNIKQIENPNIYNFYLVKETLPALYSALLMSKSNDFTYVWYGRENVLNSDNLINNNIYLSSYVGNSDLLETDVLEEAKNIVKDILQKDENAYFNLFVDDGLSWIEFDLFARYGLDDNRYHVNYISIGTGSYVFKFPYQIATSNSKYEKYQTEFNNLLEKFRSNQNPDIVRHDYYLIPAATRDNTSYYLQYPEYIEKNNDEIKEVYNKIKYITNSPTNLYNNLTDTEKQIFLDYVGLDKEKLEEQYFSDKDKPYLIITGSSPIDYGYGEKIFKHMIEQVVDLYQKDYNILYKPHPKAIPNEDYKNYFENLGIDILPGSMPMEAITFVFNDLKLGGFHSSLYMSMEKENVLFIFANNSEELFEPLNILFENEFTDVIYIKPN